MPPPPVKPPVRDENANDDQMDILANAGVNLREEEQFAMSFHTNSIRQQPAFGASGPNALGSAYTQFSTQDADSFYGSGPANQPASQIKDGKTQEEIEKEMADDAWKHAANRLAIARQQELGNPRTHVGALWSRMDKIAKDNGLTLNTDNGKMPKLKLPDEFPSQTVQIKTKVGPNGNMVVADGVFLPQDTALADQLALVSLATSFRIRGLLEEAYALSQARRLHSQGVVPPKYHDIAVPMSPDDGTIVQDIAPRHGWESAISLGTKPNGKSHHLATSPSIG